ncbi:MAG TPA: hypothetical protein VHT92_04790 [Candidatus Cybelea sp.]|jgi:hypothetical protein|nr:hypothetical protein [Candidatus Cybelea sp.]
MFLSARLARTAIAGVLCVAATVASAGATGTISIQHKDGTRNSYGDVEIKIFSGSLFLTSDDGNGTIVVNRSACSYQGKIIVCLPTSAALVQEGDSNALDLKNGTIYLNYTDSAQPLSGSSAKLPAKSIMLALTTQNGTFISLHGRIDEVIRQ